MGPNDGIVFCDEALPVKLLDIIKTSRLLRNATQELLLAVFDNGGYIAGGFGALLARHLILHEDADDVDKFENKLRRHLGVPGPIDASKRYNNAGCSDIDVWFPDDAALQAFMADERRMKLLSCGIVTATPTAANMAIEHIVRCDARVQVITRFLMPIKEQLSRFDIYNSMVAVTNDTVTFPEHWRALESARVLHVSTWKCPWTVNRFLKYLGASKHMNVPGKKGYVAVTPVTAESFIDAAIKTLQWHEELRGSSPDALNEAIDRDFLLRKIEQQPENVQRYMSIVMSALPAERLLEVSALFKAPFDYDCAMQELRNRIPVPCQKTPS